MNVPRRIWIALLLLGIILVMGSIGYTLIEGWSLLDAFYMTVITISTVGFKEVGILSPTGRLFTLLLIFLGLGAVLYTLGNLIEYFIEEHLTGLFGRRKMEKQIKNLKDHYIICGYGRVGGEVGQDLLKADKPFVVVEDNQEVFETCKEQGLLCVFGNASDDSVLKDAGITTAEGLVAAVDNDAENVFVTLSARELNPNIFIVARAALEETHEKLRKAGADRVISPAVIGGKKIASLLIRPMVCDYLDVVCSSEDIQFQLEEFEVLKSSVLSNSTLEKSGVREKTGALVLAVKNKKGELDNAPLPSTTINTGDKLIIMGTKQQLDKLQELI